MGKCACAANQVRWKLFHKLWSAGVGSASGGLCPTGYFGSMSVETVDDRLLRSLCPHCWVNPLRVSLLDPRADAECIDADADQVCGNEPKLGRAKANDANDHAVDN